MDVNSSVTRKVVAVLPGDGWVVKWEDGGREGLHLEEQLVGWVVYDDGTAQALVNADDGEAATIVDGGFTGTVSHVNRRLTED